MQAPITALPALSGTGVSMRADGGYKLALLNLYPHAIKAPTFDYTKVKIVRSFLIHK
jgi:hypothetical protein